MFENFPLLRNVKENSISVKDENIIVRKDINVSSENEQNMMRVRPVNIGFYDSVQFCDRLFVLVSSCYTETLGITLISLTLWRFLTFHFLLPAFFLNFVLGLHLAFE